MKTRILIMGLPGSGKTTLAKKVEELLISNGYIVCRLNADEIREFYDDWDFSIDGRIRQANRMSMLADESSADFVIADFIAPMSIMRDIYNADYTVSMETINAGRFENTNSLFEFPNYADARVTSFDSEMWSLIISEEVKVVWLRKSINTI